MSCMCCDFYTGKVNIPVSYCQDKPGLSAFNFIYHFQVAIGFYRLPLGWFYGKAGLAGWVMTGIRRIDLTGCNL